MLEKKILVVDYPTPERQLTVDALHALGHTGVVTAGDARAALRALEAGDIGLIITEYHLPILTGLLFIAAVRRRDGAIPILVLTNQTLETTVAASLDAGANGHLRKPISIEALRAEIEAITAMDAGPRLP